MVTCQSELVVKITMLCVVRLLPNFIYILVISSNQPHVFLFISYKAISTISISLHHPIDQHISKSYHKTAKHNSQKCIQEALANTATLIFKIHKNLHQMVG